MEPVHSYLNPPCLVSNIFDACEDDDDCDEYRVTAYRACNKVQLCPNMHRIIQSLPSSLAMLCYCIQGTKKSYRKPLFRGNSTADPDDILSPQFNNCSVPLVWWPWWPNNPADFFLTSAAPFHAMLSEGVIDKNIRFTPVTEGLTQPGYFQWYLDALSDFPVSFYIVSFVGASLVSACN